MKLFSINDLPNGRDSASFIREADRLRGFRSADVRFFDRGETTEPVTPQGHERLHVIMNGRGWMVVDDVEHPVGAGDVIIIGPGETYRAVADEVVPFVVLTLTAYIGE